MSNIRYHVWLYIGAMVFLLGLQMRMVQTFVFTPESTRVMNDWLGPEQPAATGTLTRLAIEHHIAQKQYQPPEWLGYALMSAGGVMIVQGFFLRNNS